MKTYIKPETQIILVNTAYQLLAGSDILLSTSDEDVINDNSLQLSRSHHSIWDEED